MQYAVLFTCSCETYSNLLYMCTVHINRFFLSLFHSPNIHILKYVHVQYKYIHVTEGQAHKHTQIQISAERY